MKNKIFSKKNILSACIALLLLVVVIALVAISKQHSKSENESKNMQEQDISNASKENTLIVDSSKVQTNEDDTLTVDPSTIPASEDDALSRFKKLLEDEFGSSIKEFITDVDIVSSEQDVVFAAGSTVSYEDLYTFFRDENAQGYGDDEPYIYYSHLYADTDEPLLLVRFSSNNGYPEENSAVVVIRLTAGDCHITYAEDSLYTEYAIINILKSNIYISSYHPTTNITISSFNYLNSDGSLTHLYDQFCTGFNNIPLIDKYADAFEAADINDYDYLDVWVLEYDINGQNYTILNDGSALSEDGILFKKECEKRGIIFSDKTIIDEAIKTELAKNNLTVSAVSDESVEWVGLE